MHSIAWLSKVSPTHAKKTYQQRLNKTPDDKYSSFFSLGNYWECILINHTFTTWID
jgi:hypothetical protein